MSENELYLKIDRAFSSSVYPFNDAICTVSQEINLEANAITNFFKGKHWKDVTLDKLQKEYSGDASACLFFMTPEACRYYISSYMVIALFDYDKADVIADSALACFSPPPKSLDDYQMWKENMLLYTQKQRKVIVLFIDYMYVKHSDDYEDDWIEGLRKSVDSIFQ